MPSREEIREWAKKFLQGTAHNGYYDGLELTMLEELRDLDVVIKVKRELPKALYKNDDYRLDAAWVEEAVKNDMLREGYVAVEPLIEEETDGSD